VSEGNWERARRGILCPNCGASNWPDAEQCAACGTSLDAAVQEQETIIDVSSGEPTLVTRDEPASAPPPFGGFGGFGGGMNGRTVIVRGGSRGCLIPLALFALISCCTCWLIWRGTIGLFG
jgi:hypothetical protein